MSCVNARTDSPNSSAALDSLIAFSASARTLGFIAASSPETISRPSGSGAGPSSSQHAAQASAGSN